MVTNNDIRKYLGLPASDLTLTIECVDSLGSKNDTLMFVSRKDVDLKLLDFTCHNSTFLVDESYELEFIPTENDFILVRNPKFVFTVLVEYFQLKSRLQIQHRVNPLNSIYTRRRHPQVMCDECKVGEGCEFDPGVIIGGTDFSPVMAHDRSELVQFPQLGGVIVGDHVVIKYNSMVGKGTFGYTIVGDNTMIDYGCQIGHNCTIGKSCIIAAGTIIAGSTSIGDNTTIGIGAMIRNGLKIGSNVSIGMGSVVIHDIPDGCTVVGNPARIIEHKPIFNEEGLI